MPPQYVSIDLELAEGYGQSQIIEIGAVRFDEAGQAEAWSTLVRPPGPLTYRIEQLTGLAARDLEHAPRPEVALRELAAFAGDLPCVGQSIELDLLNLERAGLRLPGPAYDTFELAVLLVPGLASYDLRSIATALGVAPRTQHRALADAETAREVFLRLLERLRALPLDTLLLVNRLAVGLQWSLGPLFQAAEQAATRAYLQEVFDRGATPRLPGGSPRIRVPAALEPPPPLVPDPSVGPLDADALVADLAAGGAVAARLPAYEERPEQLAMVRAVSAALADGEHLVVEAGTGTGKSLAYLLPAVHFAVVTGRRVVVSTNTINLQDQLVQKDLPTLAAALPYDFRVALVKGRGNYLCLRRWQAFLAQERYTAAEARLGIKIAIWLEHTATGDRAELRLVGDETAAWSQVAATAEVCTPPRCPYHRAGVCFLARARAAAESSHVIVVNHALLLSDVATGRKVLPDYRHLVVDEAHHLEDEATEQLGLRLTERELRQALDRLQQASGSYSFGVLSDVAALAQRVGSPPARVVGIVDRTTKAASAVVRARAALQDLFDEIQAFVGQRGGRDGADYYNLRLTPALRQDRAWEAVERGWEHLRGHWLDVGRYAGELLADLEDLAARLAETRPANSEAPTVGDDAAVELAAELEAFLRLGEGAEAALERIIAAPSPDEVYWISGQAGGELSLHVAPLQVGARLWEDLFSRKDSVIVTSATLTAQDSFRYIRRRIGLRQARELQLGSPYDYRSATLLYVPHDVPEPGQPYYQHRLVEILIPLITAVGGRTLVLFTSHGQLRQTHEALREPLDAQRVLLLGQNIDGSRARLLETFRAGPRAVLLGTSSFWEGVDVVGEALSCLVIARLPFTVPTDPVFAARSELFDDPFQEYAVPQAILRLRQGFGRLIRSRTDRGVVAILDRRLHSKRYGRAFLASLPDCTVRVGAASDLPRLASQWLER